jgi:hypothetical protein
MRDAMDELLFKLGHDVRADVEASVDADGAWLDHVARVESAPMGPESSQSHWGWILGAAAVLTIVVAGAVLLVRDEDSLRTDDSPTTTESVDSLPVAPASSVPALETIAPTTDSPIATTNAAPTTVAIETPPPTTIPPHTRDPEHSGIERRCVGDRCTQLVADPTGTVVSYDPDTRVLTRHSVPEVTAPVPFEGDVFLVSAGPDGAVYMQTPTSNIDPIGDLVAVSLVEGDAGREIDRAIGEADLTGDSDLVVTADGLVRVGCCGPDQVLPAVDSPLVMAWVGPTAGEAQPARTFRFDTDGWVIGDRYWPVELGDQVGIRGMPPITATLDGGFLAIFADTSGMGVTLARGWPDGTVSQLETSDFPALLEPSGRALYAEDDRFVRVELFQPPTDDHPDWGIDIGPAGEWLINPYTLNAEIDSRQPVWASDPVAFGFALAGPLGAGETRSVVSTPPANDVTVTAVTSNALDPGIESSRITLRLTRGDNGLYHFVSGEYDIACWPQHGHVDFQPVNCA